MILIANHLWQSSLFLAIAALLTRLLRNNRAQVRYWVWLAASVKFLVPFAALVGLGSQLPWPASATIPGSPVTVAIDAVSQPFSPLAPAVAALGSAVTPVPGTWSLAAVLLAVWFVGSASLLMIWCIRWRRLAGVIRSATPVLWGREWEILRRLEHTHSGPALSLLASNTSVEPGVFGILRPILLWPTSISARLSDEQIEAIFAHELTHVRRRDNLAAALHMLVQAIFWFHPLVWWVGARLIDERERACDEEVIRQGSRPQVYAESILKTVEFYVESPLVCVSGVTGSDLKKRIEQIMQSETSSRLTVWRKALLAASAAAVVVGPVIAGALNAQQFDPQLPPSAADAGGPVFDTTFIKPSESADVEVGLSLQPGDFRATNITLRMLIAFAYGDELRAFSPAQIVGGPTWLDSDRFDIVAKGPLRLTPRGSLPLMLRTMLAQRFKLIVHNESRDLPMYALVVARTDRITGPQMRPASHNCATASGRGDSPPPPPPPPPPPGGGPPACGIRILRGDLAAGGVTMPQFANALSRLAGRVVVDGTGLPGRFDLDLQWTPTPPGVSLLPSILMGIEEQLGLKLESQIGPLDVLVVDRAEKPAEYEDFMSVPPPPPPPPPPPRPRQ